MGTPESLSPWRSGHSCSGTAAVRHRSPPGAASGRYPASWEHPMKIPVCHPFRGVEAGAVDPEAAAVGILDPVIVAQFRQFAPPFGLQPLRAVGAADPVHAAAPAELQRRI